MDGTLRGGEILMVMVDGGREGRWVGGDRGRGGSLDVGGEGEGKGVRIQKWIAGQDLGHVH